MTPAELKRRVDDIIDMLFDPETAHADEDKLHCDLLKEFCPEWVYREVERLSAADFPRWRA